MTVRVGSIVLRVDEVRRLLALGATEIHWDKRPPDADYVILAAA